jgi:hypothetical protein
MPMRVWCVQLLFFSLVGLLPERAHACGVSGPDGVWYCTLEEHEEEIRPRWSVGAAGTYTSTALRFDAAVRGAQTRSAALLTAAYAPTARLRLQMSAGAGLDGELRMPNGTHDFAPGPAAAIGVGYRLLGNKPFLALTGVLSASTTRTRRADDPSVRYTAFDLRIGAALGATFFEALSPYALARVFGGPVLWRYQGEAVTGTDTRHYQLGLGVAWLIAERVNVFVEGVALGERGLTFGASAVF